MMNPHGKRVLVTGGAVRAGAYVCRAFAARGAHVLIHCRKSGDAARTLCAEIGGDPDRDVLCCDLADTKSAERMVREAGPLDFLVNNAATYERTALASETELEADRQFTVNFRSPLAMIRTFAESAPDGACVVNVLDCWIARTDGETGSYALSKKLLAEATKTAALTYAPRIRVNAVAPGPMIPPEEWAGNGMRKTLEKMPLRRKVDPEDYAETVVFAALNGSMTGSVLFVDCGMSVG